jgi:hypothetical protein
MTFWLILFAVQIFGALYALVRDPRHDARFAGDKLQYRS